MPAPTPKKIRDKAKRLYFKKGSKTYGNYSATGLAIGIQGDTIRGFASTDKWPIETVNITTSRYSDDQRETAAQTYILTGNITEAAHSIGCKKDTVLKWTNEGWFKDRVSTLREQNRIKLDSGLTELIDAARDAALDRVQNGEDSNKLGEDGKWVKKAVSATGAATVLGISFDKLRLLRDQSTSNVIASDSSRLQSLADTFRQIAQDARNPADQAIDITPEE